MNKNHTFVRQITVIIMYSPHILCLENSSEQEIDGFRTYSRDYSLNCTPLGPITITYY